MKDWVSQLITDNNADKSFLLLGSDEDDNDDEEIPAHDARSTYHSSSTDEQPAQQRPY